MPRGASSASHHPRPLTPYETSRWDVVTTLELDLKASDGGIRWKNLFFQSPELQAIRRHAGIHGKRVNKPTPVRVRIPLLDVGRAYVAIPAGTPGFATDHPGEVLAFATNPHAAGRTFWQHQAVCDLLRCLKRNALNAKDYEIGFLRLFRNTMEAMGADVDGKGGKVTLTGGQAPRFAGVFLGGATQPAFAKAAETIERYDLLSEFAASDGKDKGSAGIPDEPPAGIREEIDIDWEAAPIDDEDDEEEE